MKILTIFIKIIEKELNIKSTIIYKPMPASDVKETYADIQKSKQMLSYNPKVNLKDGLKDLLNGINYIIKYNFYVKVIKINYH